MNETAIAVMAPAMAALQDMPLHAPDQPAEGEPTTATLSPMMVVSSILFISREEVFTPTTAISKSDAASQGFCHPIAAVRLVNRRTLSEFRPPPRMELFGRCEFLFALMR
jgi:hypothetical protein